MNLPAGYPYAERKLGFEWTNGSRHQRIDEVLKSLPKVSIEDSMRLQNDIVSIPARRLVALLAPLSSDDADTRAALAMLQGLGRARGRGFAASRAGRSVAGRAIWTHVQGSGAAEGRGGVVRRSRYRA